MNLKFFQSRDTRRCGFTLIEVVLALGVFLVSILALVGLLAPMLQSIDEVEKMDEISSVVNTIDAFLQGSPDIAVRDGSGGITKTKFDAIYEAVRAENEATVFVYRYYDDGDPDADEESRIGLEVGFASNEESSVGENAIVNQPGSNPATFKLAAGPIYRVVLSASSVTPLQPDPPLRTASRDENTGIYALTQDLSAYPEGYLALEVRIFAEDPPGPDAADGDVPATDLADLLLEEPDFTYNTAIVR